MSPSRQSSQAPHATIGFSTTRPPTSDGSTPSPTASTTPDGLVAHDERRDPARARLPEAVQVRAADRRGARARSRPRRAPARVRARPGAPSGRVRGTRAPSPARPCRHRAARRDARAPGRRPARRDGRGPRCRRARAGIAEVAREQVVVHRDEQVERDLAARARRPRARTGCRRCRGPRAPASRPLIGSSADVDLEVPQRRLHPVEVDRVAGVVQRARRRRRARSRGTVPGRRRALAEAVRVVHRDAVHRGHRPDPQPRELEVVARLHADDAIGSDRRPRSPCPRSAPAPRRPPAGDAAAIAGALAASKWSTCSWVHQDEVDALRPRSRERALVQPSVPRRQERVDQGRGPPPHPMPPRRSAGRTRPGRASESATPRSGGAAARAARLERRVTATATSPPAVRRR